MPENTEVNNAQDRNIDVVRAELGQIARLASGAVQSITNQSKVNEAIVARLLSLEAQINRVEMSLPRQT
jgi:hypothetical protein